MAAAKVGQTELGLFQVRKLAGVDALGKILGALMLAVGHGHATLAATFKAAFLVAAAADLDPPAVMAAGVAVTEPFASFGAVKSLTPTALIQTQTQRTFNEFFLY